MWLVLSRWLQLPSRWTPRVRFERRPMRRLVVNSIVVALVLPLRLAAWAAGGLGADRSDTTAHPPRRCHACRCPRQPGRH